MLARKICTPPDGGHVVDFQITCAESLPKSDNKALNRSSTFPDFARSRFWPPMHPTPHLRQKSANFFMCGCSKWIWWSSPHCRVDGSSNSKSRSPPEDPLHLAHSPHKLRHSLHRSHCPIARSLPALAALDVHSQNTQTVLQHG